MVKNAITLFIITFVILVLFLPSYSKMQDLRQKNREYAQRIEDLEAKNKKLLQEKSMLENDPDYVEKVGREKMGLIRQGEKVYKVIPQ